MALAAQGNGEPAIDTSVQPPSRLTICGYVSSVGERVETWDHLLIAGGRLNQHNYFENPFLTHLLQLNIHIRGLSANPSHERLYLSCDMAGCFPDGPSVLCARSARTEARPVDAHGDQAARARVVTALPFVVEANLEAQGTFNTNSTATASSTCPLLPNTAEPTCSIQHRRLIPTPLPARTRSLALATAPTSLVSNVISR